MLSKTTNKKNALWLASYVLNYVMVAQFPNYVRIIFGITVLVTCYELIYAGNNISGIN